MLKIKLKNLFISTGVLTLITTIPIVAISCSHTKNNLEKTHKMEHSMNEKMQSDNWGLKKSEYYKNKIVELKNEDKEWKDLIKSRKLGQKIKIFSKKIQAFLFAYILEQQYLGTNKIWQRKDLSDFEKLNKDLDGFLEWIKYRFYNKMDLNFIGMLLNYFKEKNVEDLKNDKNINLKEVEEIILNYLNDEREELEHKLKEAIFIESIDQKLKEQI